MWKFFRNKVDQMQFWDWGMLKIYAFAMGIIIGAYFSEFVKINIWLFVIVAAISFIWLMNSVFFKKRM